MGTPPVAAIVKVADVAVSLEWYQACGFAVHGTHPDEAPTWAEVAYGSLTLQLLSGETPWPPPPGFTGCFYVHVDDVDAVATGVAAGGIVAPWGVEDRPWGARELTLIDPDGYAIAFTQRA